jgi:hypothetical protein
MVDMLTQTVRVTGHTEVELPHNNGSHKLASRGCGRIRIDKRAWHLSSNEAHLLRENLMPCRLART